MAAPSYTEHLGEGDLGVKTTIQESAGAGDADKIPATGADGKLDLTFLPDAIQPISHSGTFGGTVAAGKFIFADSADAYKIKAATNTGVATKAGGFVMAGGAADDPATYYSGGKVTGLTGITANAKYYLDTAGGYTTTAPTAAGSIVQVVAIGIDSTSLEITIGDAVRL